MVRPFFRWLAACWLCAACSLVNRPEERDLCVQHGKQCDPLASCSSDATEYRCECPAGYDDVAGDGTHCEDIDECSDNECDPIARCENTAGGFDCLCPDGYLERNGGRRCEEIDECRSGAHDCDTATQDCENTPGPGYRCVCKEGYRSNEDESCSDVDECAEASAASQEVCEAPQECENRPGSYVCRCGPRAQDDGVSCKAIDPCEANPCGEGARCVPLGSDYRCDCLEGYTRLLGRCQDIDECSDDPCQDGATCRNLDGSFECTCREFYETSSDGQECLDERSTWSKVLPRGDDVQPLIDATGQLFLVGSFGGELDLCGKPINAKGASDIFVAKYDAKRVCKWVRHFGGPSTDLLVAAALDVEGNILLTADCSGPIDLGNDWRFDSGEFRGRVIAKLSAKDGYAVWGREFYNLDSDDITSVRPRSGLASDRDGNVLWAGRAPRDVSLTAEHVADDPPYWDALLVKFDARSGEVLWRKRYGTSREVGMLTDVVVDPEGALIIAGQYSSNSFQFGNAVLTGVPERWNGFLARLSADGEPYPWHEVLDMDLQGTAGLDRSDGLSLAIAPSGNFVVSAGFHGALRLGEVAVMSEDGREDIMVAEFDGTTHAPLWVQTYGSDGEDQAGDLAIDNHGRIVLSGTFKGEIDFGEGPLVAERGWPDVFIASLDADGSLRWAQRFGGTGPDRAERLAIGLRDEIIATAAFTPPVLVGDTVLPETAGESVIVLQIEP